VPLRIDFSTRGELIAAGKTVAELCRILDLDTLHYLSIEGLLEATGSPMRSTGSVKPALMAVTPFGLTTGYPKGVSKVPETALSEVHCRVYSGSQLVLSPPAM